jgi:hypothetical protein
MLLPISVAALQSHILVQRRLDERVKSYLQIWGGMGGGGKGWGGSSFVYKEGTKFGKQFQAPYTHIGMWGSR